MGTSLPIRQTHPCHLVSLLSLTTRLVYVGQIICAYKEYNPELGSIDSIAARVNQYQEMEIIVVGAGIAGLSAGIALRRAGHTVTVRLAYLNCTNSIFEVSAHQCSC
jgi:NADPH-dependent glutamate synthase beta subunit-like oxidoreductase